MSAYGIWYPRRLRPPRITDDINEGPQLALKWTGSSGLSGFDGEGGARSLLGLTVEPTEGVTVRSGRCMHRTATAPQN